MKTITKLFRLCAFQTLLFCLLFCLVDWPVVTILSERRSSAIFIYLFLVWAVFVVLLFFVSLSLKPRNSGGIQKGGPPDA